MRTLRVSLSAGAFAALAVLLVLPVPSFAQSVVSTHSGVVYYFDGAVYLGDQPLESRLGKFATVAPGAELRTAQGHAELLLTPGVFLRLGENSSIRMVANDLANTRVELESGSAVVDSDPFSTPISDAGSSDAGSGTAPTLVFRDWLIRGDQGSSYRVDSDPARVWALRGDAEIVTDASGQFVRVEEGMDLPYGAAAKLEPSLNPPNDSLTAWAKGRNESITADDSITQQIDSDPGAQSASFPDAGDFSYFPPLGVAPMGTYSTFAGIAPPQPGFYSMYLPGYTYAPLLILPMMGVRGGVVVPGISIRNGLRGGIGPGAGGVVVVPVYPGAGIVHSPVVPYRPVYPGAGAGVVVRPGAPVVPHSAPAPRAAAPGVHAAPGHR